MNKLSRRTFGKRLLIAGAVPLVHLPSFAQETPKTEVAVPDSIAGYKLTSEEKKLALKFLKTHEGNMSALREKELLYSLAPSFIFASPHLKSETKAK